MVILYINSSDSAPAENPLLPTDSYASVERREQKYTLYPKLCSYLLTDICGNVPCGFQTYISTLRRHISRFNIYYRY